MTRDLEDYPIRICVAGSRSFHDPVFFDLVLRAFLLWAGSEGNYAFISGAARRGADRMIIDWAALNNKECFQFEADWNRYGKGAGYRRNADMRKQLTHLLCFWDKKSSGTKEMFEKTWLIEGKHVSLITVEPDKHWAEYCRKREQYQNKLTHGVSNANRGSNTKGLRQAI